MGYGLLVVWSGAVVVDVMCWCLWWGCHKLIVHSSGREVEIYLRVMSG